MKKTILFIALLCGVFSLMAQNDVDTTDQTVLKYCTEEIKSAGGNDYSQNEFSQAAAIKVTANTEINITFLFLSL